jgi:hypothetical protein
VKSVQNSGLVRGTNADHIALIIAISLELAKHVADSPMEPLIHARIVVEHVVLGCHPSGHNLLASFHNDPGQSLRVPTRLLECPLATLVW